MSIFLTLTTPANVSAAALDHVVRAATVFLEASGTLCCERLEPFAHRNSEDLQHLVIWRADTGKLDADTVDLKDFELIVKTTLKTDRIEGVTSKVGSSVGAAPR